MTGQCVVPGCQCPGSHHIPKNIQLRSLWLRAMKLKENDLRTKNPLVCSLHFKDTDYICNELDLKFLKKIHLKRHAVPSLFPWNKNQAQPHLSPEHIMVPYAASTLMTDLESDKENVDPIAGSKVDGNSASSVSEKKSSPSLSDAETYNDNEFDDSLIRNTYSRPIKPTQYVPELPYLMTGATYDIKQDPLCVPDSVEIMDDNFFADHDIEVAHYAEVDNGIEVKQEFEFLNDEELYIKEEENSADFCDSAANNKSCPTCGRTSIPSYSVHSYKSKPNAVHFYTGLETFDKLMFVFHSLGNSDNLCYIYGKPPDHLDPLEQFCITLLILRRHREFEDIAMTYETSVKQVSNIFITWIRFMALQWRSIDLWIDKDTVRYYMPLDFYDKYPNTRVIVDATECPIKKPGRPSAQQITFSNYKNRNTVKMLVGMAPSGMITYLSPCYGGSASDRQIIERSSILDKFDFNDEIMVDKGLNVQDIFISRGVKVNMPTFFKKGNQINPDTLTKDRKIASKRVHVERIIGMLKTYKILTQAMNHTETLLASDISFVVAMLVNFRSNIMNKHA